MGENRRQESEDVKISVEHPKQQADGEDEQNCCHGRHAREFEADEDRVQEENGNEGSAINFEPFNTSIN